MNEVEKLKEELKKAQETTERIAEKIKELEGNCYKRWRGNEGNIYYYIDGDCDIVDTYEQNDYTDDARYESGNYFKTEYDADKALEKMEIYTELKDIALRLNAGKKIDWEDTTQTRYSIRKKKSGLFLDNHATYQSIGAIYCLDENFLDVALDELGEEDILVLFED